MLALSSIYIRKYVRKYEIESRVYVRASSLCIYFYSSIILIASPRCYLTRIIISARLLYVDQLNLFTQYRIIRTWFASEIGINDLLTRATYTIRRVESIAGETFATW